MQTAQSGGETGPSSPEDTNMEAEPQVGFDWLKCAYLYLFRATSKKKKRVREVVSKISAGALLCAHEAIVHEGVKISVSC